MLMSRRATLSAPTIGRGQDGLAPPLSTVHHDIRRQHRHQGVHITLTECLHERVGQLVPFGVRGLESRAVLGHVSPGTDGQLPAVLRGLVDHPADLGVVEPEDVVQQEHCPLDRAESFQQQQERHRQRIGQQGFVRGIHRAGGCRR